MSTIPFANPRPDIAAQFRRNILAAGGMVAGPDGETLRPEPARGGYGPVLRPPVGGVHLPPPARPPLPRVIEFDEDGQEHTVVVKRRNGETVTLHGALRYGAMRDFDALQAEVTRLQAEAAQAHDRATRRALAAEQLAVEEDLLRLMFDDLPDGLIGSLDPRTVRKLTDTFGRLLTEAIGEAQETDPNAHAGR